MTEGSGKTNALPLLSRPMRFPHYYHCLVFNPYLLHSCRRNNKPIFILKVYQYSRAVVVIFLLVQFFLLSMNRSVLYRINQKMLKRGFGLKKGIIIGVGKTSLDFYNDINKHFKYVYDIIGFIANGDGAIDTNNKKINILAYEQDLSKVIVSNDIDYIFIVKDALTDDIARYLHLVSSDRNIHIKIITSRTRNLMNSVKIRDISGIPFTFDHTRYRFHTINEFLKRCLDLAFVSVTGIITLPVGLLIAMAIKLISGGPALFTQERSLSKNGKTFNFYKFRTMYNDSDKQKTELLSQNETDGALFKMKDDPRITPLGKVLRKFSLDELPQLINVIKNEMSIVGPRPLPVKDYEMLKDTALDWYSLRDNSKPGITGLWQITGRSDLSFEEMCLLDLYYIENKTPLFDLEIIFDTIPVVIFGKGAY